MGQINSIVDEANQLTLCLRIATGTFMDRSYMGHVLVDSGTFRVTQLLSKTGPSKTIGCQAEGTSYVR